MKRRKERDGERKEKIRTGEISKKRKKRSGWWGRKNRKG